VWHCAAGFPSCHQDQFRLRTDDPIHKRTFISHVTQAKQTHQVERE